MDGYRQLPFVAGLASCLGGCRPLPFFSQACINARAVRDVRDVQGHAAVCLRLNHVRATYALTIVNHWHSTWGGHGGARETGRKTEGD